MVELFGSRAARAAREFWVDEIVYRSEKVSTLFFSTSEFVNLFNRLDATQRLAADRCRDRGLVGCGERVGSSEESD
ncbi:hypothetical protein PI124_g8262 [Phytophthora idaei]|nr:hypothetical protein PI125_g8729 [Phytophthora idaei]KAG3159928.1 hypothetical protein PI126_g7135 [Phytophthora idaei]KAG3247034.1 hypothetical protein PI124_g8262 [Phytophthora idaei]